jgi:sodium-dependent dicarboxylate transporter 2/3/5
MTIGLPMVAILLPITWLLLTRVLYPCELMQVEGGQQDLAGKLHDLGRVGSGESGRTA